MNNNRLLPKEEFLDILEKKQAEMESDCAQLNAIINKLRKLAVKNHKPIRQNILDYITSIEEYSEEEVMMALKKTTLYKAVKILNAIQYRLANPQEIMFRIRNQKTYIKKVKEDTVRQEKLKKVYTLVRNYIVDIIRKNVEGKTVYIPEEVVYTVPTTEKQFVGNIPEGSYVKLPTTEALTLAIAWNNLPEEDDDSFSWYTPWRVDLDFHIMNETQHFGWNASYRNEERTILFSGDMTDATNGATEAYTLLGHDNAMYSVYVNDYTRHGAKVPFSLVVCSDPIKDGVRLDYIINPNHVLMKANFEFGNENEKNLGFIQLTEEERRYYFADFRTIDTYAMVNSEHTAATYRCQKTAMNNKEKLNDLLRDAGAVLVKTPNITVSCEENGEVVEKAQPVDINLALESITKESILNLLKK